jgi:hypothetical protein
MNLESTRPTNRWQDEVRGWKNSWWRRVAGKSMLTEKNGMNESRLASRPLSSSAVGTAFFVEVKAARAWC